MDKNIAHKKEKLYQDPDDYTLKDSIMTDESKVCCSMRIKLLAIGRREEVSRYHPTNRVPFLDLAFFSAKSSPMRV